MPDRNIRVVTDKIRNRLVIHDADSGQMLHTFIVNKAMAGLTAQQMTEYESEAIRDFLVNGYHEDDDAEPGW